MGLFYCYLNLFYKSYSALTVFSLPTGRGNRTEAGTEDTSLESEDQEEDTVSPGEEQLEDLEDQVEEALGKTGEN